MSFLVTGACGYSGAHLVRHLHETLGHNVVALDVRGHSADAGGPPTTLAAAAPFAIGVSKSSSAKQARGLGRDTNEALLQWQYDFGTPVRPEDQPAGGAWIHRVIGSLTDDDAVEGAFADAADRGAPVHTVFHLGALVPFNLPRYVSERELLDVNVGGTQRIIDACVRHGVPRLVYASSTGVVFAGHSLANADETAPYPETHNEAYSRSKALAEQAVLRADGTPLLQQAGGAVRVGNGASSSAKVRAAAARRGGRSTAIGRHRRGRAASPGGVTNGGGTRATRLARSVAPTCERDTTRVLSTVALRPNGIWGPGEMHHFPKMLVVARAGFSGMAFGPTSLTDWTHRDTLVHAFMRCYDALRAPRGVYDDDDDDDNDAGDADDDTRVHGRPFFVTDGLPVNTLAFFGHLLGGLRFPVVTSASLASPDWVMMAVASVLEAVSFVGRVVCGWRPEPFLTRANVRQCTHHYYFSSARAKAALGFAPQVSLDEGMAECIPYYRARGFDGHVPPPAGGHGVWVLWNLVCVGAALAVWLQLAGHGRAGHAAVAHVLGGGSASHLARVLCVLLLADLTVRLTCAVRCFGSAWSRRLRAGGWAVQALWAGVGTSFALAAHTPFVRRGRIEAASVAVVLAMQLIAAAALWWVVLALAQSGLLDV